MSVACAPVFVHYHLRPGGVTRVIENAVAALPGVPAVVLTGERGGDFRGDVRLAVSDELGYGGEPSSKKETQLAREILALARRRAGPDRGLIWHFHNHSLGKNAAMPLLARALAGRGERILLQIHDFAEDCRPANYQMLLSRFGGEEALASILYPQAPHVHYAVLNRRDHSFLAAAGVDPSRLHLLPNAVAAGPPAGDGEPYPKPAGRFYVYPTRAIRRKNIGEFLLWAALAERDAHFATTLAPQNPVHFPIYHEWLRFAKEQNLPASFEIGTDPRYTYGSIVRSADALLTTSVAEGFGLAFLEPWLADKPLAGRDLSGITADFRENGVKLDHLYKSLSAPLEWVGEQRLRELFLSNLKFYYDRYQRRFDRDRAEAAFAGIAARKRVDFGFLNEMLQKEIIVRVRESAMAGNELEPPALDTGPGGALTRHNRERVEACYGLEQYGGRLRSIYKAVLESETGPVIGLQPGAVLRHFLAPERFSMLRM